MWFCHFVNFRSQKGKTLLQTYGYAEILNQRVEINNKNRVLLKDLNVSTINRFSNLLSFSKQYNISCFTTSIMLNDSLIWYIVRMIDM